MSSVLTLARANARYWPSVAPAVREQLRRWQNRAAAIEEERRRALALGKLREERFNPQLAATLATQLGGEHRRAAVAAIVATQVAYDYCDALEERSLDIDDAYTRELAEAARRALAHLPGWRAVADVARTGAARCAEAQRRGHAALRGSDGELRRWAEREAAGTSLDWPEWLAGAQASVLGTHALVALAADAGATRAQAVALDRLYVSIGALSMLDSVIDRRPGSFAYELGYERWYPSLAQMGEHLATAVRDARERARYVPNGAHHLMTLAGVLAYYASAPQARDPHAQAVLAPVRAELGAAIAAPLATMRAWRLAKRVRNLIPSARSDLAIGATLALGAAIAAGAAGGDAAPAARASLLEAPARTAAVRAHEARSLSAHDEARLSYVSASGSTLYETGHATGTLPGSMRVHMRIAATFSGSFIIYASGGSIDGHGSATPHGVGVYESFSGSLTVSGGSGRFRYAHGTARLYGTFNRNSYALLIQTQGTLRY